MQLELSKKYKTVKGPAVVVSGPNILGCFIVWHEVGDYTRMHKPDGTIALPGSNLGDYNIISEWKEPLSTECIMNVYSAEPHSRMIYFGEKCGSDLQADIVSKGLNLIGRVHIKWTEGVGAEIVKD